jgi:dTDP-4-amino-4,6-dideoxygalactose transaminase
MQNKYLPFALPDISEEEINAVVHCMRSGWLTTGPMAKQFETDFSNFLGGNNYSVALNSASMGLQLAMEALGVAAGDEVIIPTYTFSATGMMAVHLGAKPVLVDVNPHTLNIDPAHIERAITKKTKAIVPVHIAGLACPMDEIIAIAQKHDLKVIEDAAHCLPTTYKGKVIGNNTSDATIFSFYATKTITTGEGGMIVTPNEEVAKRCQIMRLHGISRDAFDRYTARGAKWSYEIVAEGYKCNLTDIAASIGIEQLKKANSFLARRTHIANLYNENLKNLAIELPAKALAGDVHSWHLYVIKLKDEVKISRDDFILKMDEAGIGCSVHFIPLHYHPFWQQKLQVKKGDFPQAEKAFERVVSLPIYTKMTDDDVMNVIAAVRKILC